MAAPPATLPPPGLWVPLDDENAPLSECVGKEEEEEEEEEEGGGGYW